MTTEIEKKQWTDQQMKRRRNISATTGYIGSAIGLTALGASAVGSKTGGRAVKRLVRLAPQAKQAGLKAKTKVARAGAKKATTPLLTAGAGVGGVGGLNFAAIQHQDATKPKVKPKVVVVNNTTRKKLKPSDFSKAAPFNAEQRRHRRNKVEAGALATGSGAALAGAGYQANRARQDYMKLGTLKTKKAQLRRLGMVRSSTVKAGALTAVGAAGVAGAAKLAGHEKSRSGRTYAPQYRPKR